MGLTQQQAHYIAREVQKRLHYPYIWGRKQTNNADTHTKFIYQICNFRQLLKRLAHIDTALRNYALARWYNFWTTQLIEYIFHQHERVTPFYNAKDKYRDIYFQ